MPLLKLLLAGALLLLSTHLLAHTGLKTSVPNDQSTVMTPENLELEFKADVRLIKLSLSDANGADIALDFKPQAKPATHFVYAVSDALSPGDYTVQWTAMGKDTHKMTGQFVFRVENKKQPCPKTE